MVQILPPKTSLGASLGMGLGEGAGKALSNYRDYRTKESNIDRALKGVQEAAANPNLAPGQLETALMKASAMIPGSERYLSDYLSRIQQRQQLQRQPGQQQDQPTPSARPTISERVEPILAKDESKIEGKESEVANNESDNVDRMIQEGELPKPSQSLLGNLEGLWDRKKGELPYKYSADQIAQQEAYDKSLGYPVSHKAELMRTHNQETQNQVGREVQFLKDSDQVYESMLKRQESFETLAKSVRPDLGSDDLRVLTNFGMTPKAQEAKTDRERLKIAQDYFNRYEATKNNLANSNRWTINAGGSEKIRKNIHNSIKWLVDLGQRDIAKQLLIKDLKMGDAQSELTMNPIAENNQNLLTDFKFTPLEKNIAIPVSPNSGNAPQERIKENRNLRNKELKNYENRLSKVIKPGTAENPGTSLIGARAYALKSGINWQEFNDLVQNLVSEGKLELDPYQRSELPKLSNSPFQKSLLGLFDYFFDRH